MMRNVISKKSFAKHNKVEINVFLMQFIFQRELDLPQR